MHQLLIAGVPSTGLLTGPAELGARTACDDVIRRTTQHEVGARLAQLGTIKQHADEVDLGVVATARDAMLKRQRADSVAVKALLNGLLQIVMLLVVAIAFAGLAMLTHAGMHNFWTGTFPLMAVMGLGMALVVSPLSTAIMTSVEDKDTGAASGINNAVSRIGGALCGLSARCGSSGSRVGSRTLREHYVHRRRTRDHLPG